MLGLRHAAAARARGRRLCRDAHRAAARARGPQRRALRRAVRLVLCRDADPDRPGRRDRFTMPIWTALLAVAFLDERMNAAEDRGDRARPRRRVDDRAPAARRRAHRARLISLAAAVGFSIALTMVKSLTGTDSVVRIIFWMFVLQRAIGLAPALLVWRTPARGLAVDRARRVLRHVLALLHGARDAPCRRDGRGADGLPARAADRNRGVAGLRRGHRLWSVAGARADPRRQSAQRERWATRCYCCCRWSLTAFVHGPCPATGGRLWRLSAGRCRAPAAHVPALLAPRGRLRWRLLRA